MGLYKIDKEIVLMDGKSIIIDIDIPFAGELDETKDYSLIEEIMIESLYHGTRGAIEKYKASALPDKYIEHQSFIVTNNLPDKVLGAHATNGNICLEADAMQGICYVSASFLLAHEVGHKILNYIDKSKALKDIGDVLGLTSEYYQIFLSEIFADACGNLTSKDENYDVLGDRITFDENTSEAIKQRTLYNIYRV